MDWFFAKLGLSVAVFAPGLILLSILLVVGVLVTLEQTGVFALLSGKAKNREPQREQGQQAGPIVAELDQAIHAEAQNSTGAESHKSATR